MTQHSSLTPERWRAFSLDQQILMIGNEMLRASKMMAPEHRDALQRAYERVLRLVDLTVEVQTRRTLRKELLRWRDLAAQLYVQADVDPVGHRAALRCLLLLTPVAAQQIRFVCG